MTTTPNSERVHITIFGLRNAGKSSLINAIASRSVAIVSSEPGTTTDPVSRPMELGALGPVVLTDTAGLDDVGDLGSLRVGKSLERLDATDIALLATALDRPPAEAEEEAMRRLRKAGKAIVVVGTFADRESHPDKEGWLGTLGREGGERVLLVHRASSATGEGVAGLRSALAGLGNRQAVDGKVPIFREDGPLEGLVEAGDLVMLVTPIDSAAPRGRLILPEAETLRDCLDRACPAVVTRELELPAAWAALGKRPRLVVTDSQAFAAVAAAIPEDQALTSFSILFARKKGELRRFGPGIRKLRSLAIAASGTGEGPGRPLRLLALEACTHNRTHEDIAAVKIPALLAARTGRKVELTLVRELSDAPVDRGFDLAVVCGSCMATRGKFLSQMAALEEAGVPALNFGLFLAWANGLLERAVAALGEEAAAILSC
jgi:[FeFe] hydrogenase H-cluster maturation GTPase HydF